MKYTQSVAVATKTIITAKLEYVTISDINEPVGLNGGDINKTRWDLESSKVLKSYLALQQSIIDNGFLVGVVAMRLNKDVVLYGETYKEGTWLALDVNGRIRVLKDLLKSGYTLNTGTEIENKVPVIDITHLVINKTSKMDEGIIEDMWDILIALNTGQLQWTVYDFISTGARALKDPKQKEVWTYLANQMKKYKDILTNNTVLGGTIKSLTDSMKKNKNINFDMRFKRYSDEILDNLSELRKHHSSKLCKAPFLTMLGRYLLKFTNTNVLIGMEYDEDKQEYKTKKKNCFEIKKYNLYDDGHFSEFQNILALIFTELKVKSTVPKGGYPGGEVQFELFMNQFMLDTNLRYGGLDI